MQFDPSIVRWHGRRRLERFLERFYWATKAEDPQCLVTYVNYSLGPGSARRTARFRADVCGCRVPRRRASIVADSFLAALFGGGRGADVDVRRALRRRRS